MGLKGSLFAIIFAVLGLFSMATQAEEIKQTFNGQTVNANLVFADGKSFGDKVALLLHGTLTHNGRSNYIALQENLAKLGISTLSMNLSLGLNDRHGEYDCATPHTHKHTDALAEIGFWLNWLKQQGVKQVTLIGHSRGGNQIEWFAHEKDNAMINKVVLLAPATGEQQSAKDYQEKYGKPLAPILKKAQDLVKAGKGQEMMKDVDFIYCEKAQVTAAAFADYYTVKPQFDTPSLLKSVKKPTLVFIASEDQFVPELAARMEPLKGTKNLTIETIDGADHFFMDLANEDVAASIAKFLQ
ncbi:MAG: alpha/beta hydrolase [Thiotrichales bacterium]|jgi:pimeloyl-ACP methyl ester carboxylesterase|nr:alpha/beta hydrolase [Thiotrichales bacterium]